MGGKRDRKGKGGGRGVAGWHWQQQHYKGGGKGGKNDGKAGKYGGGKLPISMLWSRDEMHTLMMHTSPREWGKLGRISVLPVETRLQLADAFTKALPRAQHEFLLEKYCGVPQHFSGGEKFPWLI